MSVFDYQKDADGIVTITMDMPGPVNAMNQVYRDAMAEAIKRLESEKDLIGVIIASAKKTFFAGGDLRELLAVTRDTVAEFQQQIEITKNDLRRLEKLPVPVVAAINGAALGGGCEIALACNYRMAVNQPGVVVGMPEVTLGLLPGAGGVVRSVHMLGLEKALPLLLEGKKLRPRDALEKGLIDQVVDDQGALLPAARNWIKSSGAVAEQPWDRKGHRVPGGDAKSRSVAPLIAANSAMLQKKTRGLSPAHERVLAVAAESSFLDFDVALQNETRGLVYLANTPQARNIITTMFFQMNAINDGRSRPQTVEQTRVKKVGVLGAGMMGQGIAYSSAMAGIEVVLLDVSLDAAKKGKAYSEKLLDKAITRGRCSEERKAEVLGLIHPTDNYDDLDGSDFIAEAVFESVKLKGDVTAKAEPKLADGGVFGTNTSTLPITLLAEAADKPENFIGVHFFSPVDKMPLVEIIRGEKTSDETLARAFDYARQIGKTAIVVNDSLGFFTSRTIGTYLDEACRILREGADPVLIENLAKQIGMPAGPLTVLDEVSMELMRKVNETQKEMGVFGSKSDTSVSDEIGSMMINDHDRGGRHYGGGFFEYPTEGEKQIWPKLYELFHRPGVDMPYADIKDRILFRQVIEAVKCLQEGVLSSAADGNVGSILGIGAPVWTGGFIQFVNTYGVERFIARTRELEKRYGPRFAPPRLLMDKAEAGETLPAAAVA